MKKVRKKKGKRFDASFTMRFDALILEMLDRIAYEEDRSRPDIIRSAIKYLFLKKYEPKELEKLRKKHRPHNNDDGGQDAKIYGSAKKGDKEKKAEGENYKDMGAGDAELT